MPRGRRKVWTIYLRTLSRWEAGLGGSKEGAGVTAGSWARTSGSGGGIGRRPSEPNL